MTNNYLATYATPINSAQGDLRLDHTLTSKQQIYARFTYKNRRVLLAPGNGANVPEQGATSQPQISEALVMAHNWTITPTIINEARGGFTQGCIPATAAPSPHSSPSPHWGSALLR